MSVYRKLSEGGGFNLPFLLHIYDRENNFYLINDNADFTYKDITYKSSNFTYTPQPDGASTLNIEICEHDKLIDLLENNTSFKVDVIGVFNGETVEELRIFKHKYGSGTWNGKTLELKLNKDDRGQMTFPALTFDIFNNRGNS